jgi:hypothetical protein
MSCVYFSIYSTLYHNLTLMIKILGKENLVTDYSAVARKLLYTTMNININQTNYTIFHGKIS